MSCVASAAAPAVGSSRLPKLSLAWFGLAVLVAVTVLAAVDRQILALLTEPLKHSLGLSDTQIGVVNGLALSLVYGLATVPMGWLADRMERRLLLAASILVWSAGVAACGLASGYGALLVASMVIAVGESVLGSVSYAFIPDLFPVEHWVRANAIFFMATLLGTSAGLILSGGMIGVISAHHGALTGPLAELEPWRLTLLAAALAGPVLAMLTLCIRTRKASGVRASGTEGSLFAHFREHLRTFIGVFTGFGFVAAAFGTLLAWLPVVLVRIFDQNPAATGQQLGLVTAAGTLLGTGTAMLCAGRLRTRLGITASLRIARYAAVLAFACVPLLLLAKSTWQVHAILVLQLSFTVCALSLSPTLLQLLAPRAIRARVIAIGGLFSLVLQSSSPVLVGAVSDALSARPDALLLAVVIVAAPCYLAGAALLSVAEPTLARTCAIAASEAEQEKRE